MHEDRLGPKGYNIRTVMGRYVDLARPSPDQVDSVDLAFALSNIARFNGHARFPVTVLEHVLNAYDRAMQLTTDEDIWMAALIHDAHEAYVCDVPTPLKHLIGPMYREVEDQWQNAVFMHVGVPIALAHHDIVKAIDREMLLTEARDFHGVSETELAEFWPAGKPLDWWLDRQHLPTAQARFVNLVENYRSPQLRETALRRLKVI